MLHYGKLHDWNTYADTISSLLKNIVITDSTSKPIETERAFKQWLQIVDDLRPHGGEIFFIGNGASAGLASHCATDIFKNGRIRTRTFTDPALISAIGNDVSFEQVYALPLEISMRKGDVLVAISSSGASPNILAAADAARRCSGKIVTLSAFSTENPLRQKGDLNFYVPADTYGCAESCHSALLHYWIDRIIVGHNKNMS